MDRLMMRLSVVCTSAMLSFASIGFAQQQGSAAVQKTVPSAAGSPAASKPAPLALQTLDSSTRADPFPPANPKNFTADSPTVATVDSYLHAMLGYDASRIWRVVAIQKTPAAGVSKVVALVSDKAPNSKVQSATFYILPDGRHLVSDASGVQGFGADPFAENRAMLRARANGPAQGAPDKDLMLVEFADLQCPHCKEAQAVMTRLAQDFPRAREVFESLPLVNIHPFAYKAAEYGACIAQKDTRAFFSYAQAVYDTQAALTAEEGDNTLKKAATKVGQDAQAVATCAASPAAAAMVDDSTKLAADLGVDQTPLLAVNGRILPLTGIPYETLKNLVAFQATLDGVPGYSSSPILGTPAALTKP